MVGKVHVVLAAPDEGVASVWVPGYSCLTEVAQLGRFLGKCRCASIAIYDVDGDAYWFWGVAYAIATHDAEGERRRRLLADTLAPEASP